MIVIIFVNKICFKNIVNDILWNLALVSYGNAVKTSLKNFTTAGSSGHCKIYHLESLKLQIKLIHCFHLAKLFPTLVMFLLKVLVV